MVENFKGSLGKGGYFISVKDKNYKLPSGEMIANGETFRNTFILRDEVECDMLVPCGGRPETINPYNYTKLFKNGKPRFKYLVEGANLFCTEAVRPKTTTDGYDDIQRCFNQQGRRYQQFNGSTCCTRSPRSRVFKKLYNSTGW